MKLGRRIVAILLTMILCFSFLPGMNAQAASKKIKLSKTKVTMYVGDTSTLKLNNAEKSITWSTSNKKIVTVSKNGVIKAKKTGKATIKAKYSGKTYSCKVTVKKKPQSLNKKTLTLEVGQKQEISLQNYKKLSGKKIKKVKWTTSDRSVATVKYSGKYRQKATITAKKIGNAQIKVVYDGKTYSCKVKVGESRKAFFVKFKSNGGTSVSDQTVVEGNPVIKPEDPEREGYCFEGWYSDKALKKLFSFENTIIDSHLILYAKWLPKDDSTYTRGEWIHKLLQQLEISADQKDTETNYYSDTADHKYGKEIELAREYGIIPASEDEQDVPEFHPDNSVTREFAAITAALSKGFADGTADLKCEDKEDIQHPGLVQAAIDNGFIFTEENYFYPDRELDGTEVQQILDAITNLDESVDVEKEEEAVTYEKNVIADSLKDNTKYSVQEKNGQYLIKIKADADTRKIKKNAYFVLPANEEQYAGLALKAVSVEEKNGMIYITGQKPEDISKVVSNISYAGEATPLVDKVEVLDDAITYTYDKDGSIEDDEKGLDTQALSSSHGIPGKWTFNFGEGYKIGNKAKLSGKVDVTIPNVTAMVDVDFKWLKINVKECTFKVTEKAKITGQFEYTLASQGSETVTGAVEFARVPFALGSTGMSVDLVFSFYYDVKGNISISYTVEATEGIQYSKDGGFRFITNFNHQLDFPSIEASGQAGLQPAINLTCFEIWDLIGINGRIGAAASASVVNHATENLCCVDGTIYLAAKIGLNQDTLLGEWLKEKKHYTLEKEIFNKNNSPLKLKLHFENLKKVEKCTFGTGEITGFVYEAGTKNPIKNARIRVYKDDSLKAVAYSDSKGKYSIKDGLPAGDVVISISATGYKTYKDYRTVSKTGVTYIESYMMVGKDDTSVGKVSGAFKDAVTGEILSSVTYELRNGWGNTTGDLLISASSDGKYEFEREAGNYTLLAKADGYISNSTNLTITGNDESYQEIVLAPEGSSGIDQSNNIRIVLTWGSSPSDLDSHLFGPTVDQSGEFHVYYSNKDYKDSSSNKIVNLDCDDTDSYGPETTTIYQMNNTGKYSYYVQDYSNKSSTGSFALSESDAKVKVYNGNKLFATYSIPNQREGTVWHVFDYDAATGIMTPINQMYNNSDSSNLGRNMTTLDTDKTSSHIEQITESLKDEKEE